MSSEAITRRVAITQRALDNAADWQVEEQLWYRAMQCIAHGIPSSVKICADRENAGWLRTSIRGNHFYAWWQFGRSVRAREAGIAPDDILIADIRHHDDHSPLRSVGQEIACFSAAEVAAQARCTHPWTAEQLQFLESPSPTRILHGAPGTGKTTTLWSLVRSAPGGRTLYVTWSRDLRSNAEEWFRAFPPESSSVQTTDFHSLLELLTRRNITRLDMRSSYERWEQAHKRQHFETCVEEFATYRGAIIGRHWCEAGRLGTATSNIDSDTLSREARKQRLSMRNYDVVAASGHIISEASVFPELAAAECAIQNLSRGELPEELKGITSLVVDECQDLSLRELRVLELLRIAINRHRPSTDPRLRTSLTLAGDEGQTTRPSGFMWRALEEVLGGDRAEVMETHLSGNLRSTPAIVEVLSRLDRLYESLPQALRPARTASARMDTDSSEAGKQVFTVTRATADAFLSRVRDWIGTPHLSVICASQDSLSDASNRVHEGVAFAAEMKGLERDTVVVLDAGRTLKEIRSASPDARRQRLDLLRVAISRATQRLVLVGDADELDAIADWRSDPEALDREFVHLTEAGTSEVVQSRLERALALYERDRARCWATALEVAEQIPADDRNPAFSASRVVVSRLVARAVIDGIPSATSADAVAELALRVWESDQADAAFMKRSLTAYLQDSRSPVIAAWILFSSRSESPFARELAAGWSVIQRDITGYRCSALDAHILEQHADLLADSLGVEVAWLDRARRDASNALRVSAPAGILGRGERLLSCRLLESITQTPHAELSDKWRGDGEFDRAIFHGDRAADPYLICRATYEQALSLGKPEDAARSAGARTLSGLESDANRALIVRRFSPAWFAEFQLRDHSLRSGSAATSYCVARAKEHHARWCVTARAEDADASIHFYALALGNRMMDPEGWFARDLPALAGTSSMPALKLLAHLMHDFFAVTERDRKQRGGDARVEFQPSGLSNAAFHTDIIAGLASEAHRDAAQLFSFVSKRSRVWLPERFDHLSLARTLLLGLIRNSATPDISHPVTHHLPGRNPTSPLELIVERPDHAKSWTGIGAPAALQDNGKPRRSSRVGFLSGVNSLRASLCLLPEAAERESAPWTREVFVVAKMHSPLLERLAPTLIRAFEAQGLEAANNCALLIRTERLERARPGHEGRTIQTNRELARLSKWLEGISALRAWLYETTGHTTPATDIWQKVRDLHTA